MLKALKVTTENLPLIAKTITHWSNDSLMMSDLENITLVDNAEDGVDTYVVAQDCHNYEGTVALLNNYTETEFFQLYPNATHIDTTEFKDI